MHGLVLVNRLEPPHSAWWQNHDVLHPGLVDRDAVVRGNTPRLCSNMTSTACTHTLPSPIYFFPHQLLELGARINAIDRSKATALHLAVQFGQSAAVRLLAAAEADLEAQDWSGRTALHHACTYARMNNLDNTMAESLVSMGADVHSLDFCRLVA